MIPLNEHLFMTIIVFTFVTILTFVLFIISQKISSRRTSSDKSERRSFRKQLIVSVIAGIVSGIGYYVIFMKGPTFPSLASVSSDIVPQIQEIVSATVSEPAVLHQTPEIISTDPASLTTPPAPVENLTHSVRKIRRYQRGFI